MKKILILAIILIILGLGFYFYNKKEAQAPANYNYNPGASSSQVSGATSSASQKSGGGQTPAPATFSPGGETPGANIQVVEVDFNGSSFAPNTVTIHQNDYVFFKNKSTVDFWPASNPHPTHTDYPGFDAGKPIPPGGEYKFQFTKIGSWGYHDHLDPSIGGTVVVSQ